MKLITKFVAAAVLVAGFNTTFADDRKESTMDAGKGAFKLSLSVPSDLTGPFDFAGNKGPVVNDLKGKFLIGEIMYKGSLSDTAGVFYKVRIDKSYVVETEDQRITAEKLAQLMINKEGFKGREQRIPCPPSVVEGAEMVCYKMVGSPIISNKELNHKKVSVLAAVAFGNGALGYTLMGSSYETDLNKFDASLSEKRANGAIVQLYKNHRVIQN